MLSRLLASKTTVPMLLGGALASFDLNHLASAVLAAGWAHVVSALHAATLAARNQCWCRNEVVASSIALASAADSLFRKSTHGLELLYCRFMRLWLRISPPRRFTVVRSYCSSLSSNC